MDEPQTPATGPAPAESPPPPGALVPAAVWDAAVAAMSAAGTDPDRQRAALEHAAGLAVWAGLSVRLPVADFAAAADAGG